MVAGVLLKSCSEHCDKVKKNIPDIIKEHLRMDREQIILSRGDDILCFMTKELFSIGSIITSSNKLVIILFYRASSYALPNNL